jgi:hypothetical protein
MIVVAAAIGSARRPLSMAMVRVPAGVTRAIRPVLPGMLR